MKICKNCIQPDTRPGIYFNEEGVCGACLWENEKKKIDWQTRWNELEKIANWAKNTKQGNYDCVIGVSGGKDSTRQALTARDNLGLRCLLVYSEPEGITDIGRYNIENLKNLGFDLLSLRPNPKIMKKLIKRDFYTYLNPIKITEYSLWSSTYIIADQFNIPLLIQGENPSLTLGVSLTVEKDDNALNADQQNTLKSGWDEYVEIDGIDKEDLFLFHYDKKSLKQKQIRGVWLQYYLQEWSFRKNYEFSKKYGFLGRSENFDPESIGTYVPFSQVDTDLVQVNQMHKFIKFGFGQCMDHVCYDLRDGLISRDHAIDLVKKYDGKCSEFFIKHFCDYIGISLDEYWEIANKFRGDMWKQDSNGNWYNTLWDLF